MKGSLRLLMLAGCVAVLGCEGDILASPRELGPGPLDLQVATPNADDGALLIAIRGGPVDSVTSPEFAVTALEVSEGEYRLLIRGAIHSGLVARLWVPDRRARLAYIASMAQAVSGSTYQRRALAEYSVTVSRAPAP
jgi:hypothetical protein